MNSNLLLRCASLLESSNNEDIIEICVKYIQHAYDKLCEEYDYQSSLEYFYIDLTNISERAMENPEDVINKYKDDDEDTAKKNDKVDDSYNDDRNQEIRDYESTSIYSPEEKTAIKSYYHKRRKIFDRDKLRHDALLLLR